MILKMNLEIETEGMTLLQLAALVDTIKHASGVDGRVKCCLSRKSTPLVRNGNPMTDVDVSELLTATNLIKAASGGCSMSADAPSRERIKQRADRAMELLLQKHSALTIGAFLGLVDERITTALDAFVRGGAAAYAAQETEDAQAK